MEARNVLVLQTYVVQNRDRSFHYELHFSPDVDSDAPRTILVTRDERQYEQALDAEGTPARFTATWHRGARNGKPCQVLDRLQGLS